MPDFKRKHQIRATARCGTSTSDLGHAVGLINQKLKKERRLHGGKVEAKAKTEAD